MCITAYLNKKINGCYWGGGSVEGFNWGLMGKVAWYTKGLGAATFSFCPKIFSTDLVACIVGIYGGHEKCNGILCSLAIFLAIWNLEGFSDFFF